jgi:tRNA splicing ligase
MSKFNRIYHLPFSPGATNDDRIAKNSSELIGKYIIISEKLDGENTGFTNGGVYARSHAEFTKNPWAVQVRQLQSILRNDIPDDVFLFGENMEGIHSIEYSKLTSPFYMFGIRENKTWYSWEEVEEWAYLLDIPTTPVLFKGKVNSIKELENLISTFLKNGSILGGEIEGVVVRRADSFDDKDFKTHVQKYVRADHVKCDEHWTRNWVRANINFKYT